MHTALVCTQDSISRSTVSNLKFRGNLLLHIEIELRNKQKTEKQEILI